MSLDREENLKIKLKSVTKLSLRKVREELTLRTTERILSDEFRSTKLEIDIMSVQLEDLKHELCRIKSQIAMIGICEASEKTKIENHIANIVHHQQDFDNLFAKENETIQMHKLDLKKRELEELKLEEQKEKIMEEKNQLLEQEAQIIEEECDMIEQECVVLRKRNKAIMLKLKRKLIETENMRRELIKNEETT